jgi:hypothetical protein
MREQQELLEMKRRMTTRLTEQNIEFTDCSKKIAEANEICKMLGMNIKFRQIFVKQLVDDSGRSMSISSKSDTGKSQKFKEEL